MRKMIKIKPGTINFQRPFAGDCTRQNQLNRSVDDLVRSQDAEITPRPKARSLKSKALDSACCLLFFTALIGCAYGVMAL